MIALILTTSTALCAGILYACLMLGRRTVNGGVRDVAASIGALAVVIGALCTTGVLYGAILATLRVWTGDAP